MKRKLACGAMAALLAGIGAGCQSYLVFNTDTKVGLDISQSAQQQPEVTFGFQRVAVASMPVATNGTKTALDATANYDAYSVVGSISVGFKPDLNTNGGIRILQLFATGKAAEDVAKNPDLVGLFAKDLARIYVKTKLTNAPPSSPGMNTTAKP